ncbi:MAG: T9SS type A sorting domain-containing protein [Cytophagales bacterium]|nr:T9SS type A sorting domain-containing protein [Cytophagales bacterium]
MRTKTFLIVLFMLAATYLFAQHKMLKSSPGIVVKGEGKKDKVIKRTCGTMAYLEQQKTSDPVGFEKRMNLIETQVQKWKKNHPNSKTNNVVITIPVVVHVVWETATQNISDAQVISQIDVLNEDYRRLNADSTLTPSGFVGVAADCDIEFCLALRDPSGNPTNGITRTQTTVNSWTNDDIKYTAQLGADAWPKNDYLNIWVGNLGGSLLGYATFPNSGPAAEDGVVCGYNYFGRVGTLSPPFNKGRTATHEIGHWFALYHTFDGGCVGTASTNCFSMGDRVCDTPPTSSFNWGCPPGTQNTCTETPVDQNDMTSNFMDYTDDACMNIFTQGQKTRMMGTLNGPRASIKTSQGCIPPSLPLLDAGIISILTPDGTGCADSINPVVTLKNFASDTLTSVTINYQIDADPVNTYSWTGNLATNGTVNINLPAIPISLGGHIFKAYTTNPNGGTDTITFNDAHIHHINCIITQINDDICNADSLLFNIADSSDNTNATAAPGEIPGSCWEDNLVNNSVWFSFIATATGNITATTIAGSMTNSQLTLYVSADNTCSGLLTPFTCNEDIDTAAGNYMSEIAFTGLTPGQIYFLQVDGFNGDQGSFSILLKDQVSSSISEWNNQNTVNIYPNPVNGFVNIGFNFEVNGLLKLSLIDILGQIAYSQEYKQIKNNNFTLDLNNLNNGIYFLKIDDGERIVVKKIIINK